MDNNTKIIRVEEKYPLSFLQCSGIYSALSSMLTPDSFNNPDSYMIRSVYFDDYSETAYYDKINGVDYRSKLRLRIYPPDFNNVKLEIKEKWGGVQQKHTLLINRDDAEALINKDYDIALKNASIEEFLLKNNIPIYSMRPVVMNQYRRSAFMHDINNTRVTIDRSILSNETNFDLFGKNPVMFPVMDYYEALLEVKYDNFLFQWISDLFKIYGLNKEAYSKYVFSRRLFESYIS
jgi:hypothetical protein